MTPNILQHVRKTLNLKIPVCLYQRLLDCLNITHTIILIISFGFEDLIFLILPRISSIGNIEKTMIFVDGAKTSIALGIYLQTFLSNNLKDRGNDVIKSF